MVEGIAPNDLGIIDFWYPKMPSSVTATHSTTGFGLLKVSQEKDDKGTILFEHYKTIDYTTPFDSVQIHTVAGASKRLRKNQ